MHNMKTILIKESTYHKLFEENDTYNTPQQLLINLVQIGQKGSLGNGSMTSEEINNIIQTELETNQDLQEFNGKENINYYGFVDNITSQNGKIYIERAVTLNSVDEIFSYDGLGTSWSWEKGGAESYYGNGNILITFNGFVKPEDIDWKKTIFLNAYPLNEQKELRVKTNTIIEINGFSFNGKKYKLKNPILENSGSHDIEIM